MKEKTLLLGSVLLIIGVIFFLHGFVVFTGYLWLPQWASQILLTDVWFRIGLAETIIGAALSFFTVLIYDLNEQEVK